MGRKFDIKNIFKKLGLSKAENIPYKKEKKYEEKIHSNESVDGKILLGYNTNESIIVDSEISPTIKKLYEEAKEKSTEGEKVVKHLILSSVYETVKKAMPKQGEEEVEKLLRIQGKEKNEEVSLETFLKKGVGTDRHNSLTCAVILELFKKDLITTGTASIAKSTEQDKEYVWCKYINSGGIENILDVSREYIGRIKRASVKNLEIYKTQTEF
jgi:hypothetical protein